MTPHPWVTVYHSEDGTWKATWSDPETKALKVLTFRKHGILTAADRLAWAIKKSLELGAERLARAGRSV